MYGKELHMSTHELREVLARLDEEDARDRQDGDAQDSATYGMQTNTMFSKRMYRRRNH